MKKITFSMVTHQLLTYVRYGSRMIDTCSPHFARQQRPDTIADTVWLGLEKRMMCL